jgi:beta-galactosidase
LEDGLPIQDGVENVPALMPGEGGEVDLPLVSFQRTLGAEYHITLTITQRADEGLLPAGTLVAEHQFALPSVDPVPPQDPSGLPYLEVDNRVGQIFFRGPDFEMEVDGRTAEIRSYTYRGVNLIQGGPRPNFWRAPTDNDYGGRWQERLGVWREAGPGMVVEAVELTRLASYAVLVEASASLQADPGSRYDLVYTVLGNGDVIVESSLLAGEEELPRMPRFGLQMELPRELERVQWLGRGPHESHWDRKAGALVRSYEGLVTDQYHPYVRPQESGNKTDVRWMAFRRPDDTGLMIMAQGGEGEAMGELPYLSMSALHFTQDDLDDGPEKNQRHSGELDERDLVAVNVDLRQMGVGGINSWGPTALPQYSLPYGDYGYRFIIRPLSSAGPPVWELARHTYRLPGNQNQNNGSEPIKRKP